jgi:kynureninase
MFDFGLDYAPAPGLQHFLTGTPPILAITAIEPGVDLLLEAGMARLRAKSVALTEYLIALWEAELAPLGFAMNSPRDAARRGSHISLGHADAWRIDQAMIHQAHVLPDFRAPDNIRLGIAPLYTSFTDIFTAVQRIKELVHQGVHRQYDAATSTVT